eukprot:590230-Amphidinium_carterae.3
MEPCTLQWAHSVELKLSLLANGSRVRPLRHIRDCQASARTNQRHVIEKGQFAAPLRDIVLPRISAQVKCDDLLEVIDRRPMRQLHLIGPRCPPVRATYSNNTAHVGIIQVTRGMRERNQPTRM